jgi:peptidoglycan-associated lipoprotein
MTDDEQGGTPQPYRLAGEDTPKWLMLGFALIGVLTAVAAAWVFLSEPPASPQQPSPEIQARKESGSPDSVPSAPPLAEPSPSAVAPPSTAPSEDGRKPIPQEPLPLASTPPPAPTAEETQRTGQPPDQAVSAKAPSPVTPCPQPVTIRFRRGSARPIITDIDTHVAPLREWLTKHPEAKLSAEGHADSIGRERSNLILSYRRAKAVVALLHKAGIPREQLAVLAAGEHQPIAGLPDTAALNRRVLLQIEGSENCRTSSTDSEPR